MREEILTVGYHTFAPERQKVLFRVNEHKMSGMITTLHRDEVDITWVRESNSFAMLSWKGHEIKRYSCYHDSGRYLSSSDDLRKGADKIAQNLDITRESELEVHVIQFLVDSPTLGFVKKEWGRDLYRCARSPSGDVIWEDDPRVQNGAKFDFDTFFYEDRKQITSIRHSPTKVWSSAWSDQESADAFDNFKVIATAPERIIGVTDYPFDSR